MALVVTRMSRPRMNTASCLRLPLGSGYTHEHPLVPNAARRPRLQADRYSRSLSANNLCYLPVLSALESSICIFLNTVQLHFKVFCSVRVGC
jgi:hypothetical protein